VPILVIHGTADRTFPLSMGRRIFEESATAQKHWCEVEGRGHEDLPITQGPALEAIREFVKLTANLPGPDPPLTSAHDTAP
jgi:hypothetical protein